MKKASIIMAVLACAIIAAAYTNSVPISANTRAATEKWTAIRFEPALPPTPENAASKFLDGNREWQTVAAEQDLAALRTYHYGSPDIVESPAEWFVFNAGTITAFNWEAGRENVVIPWAIGGVPVTAIGANAFYDLGAYLGFPVTSVIAPQTVTTIGNGAFYGCSLLSSVSLPQAQTVGDNAFANCGWLSSVSLPQAQTISDSAFANCGLLSSVSLPQAQTVGDNAFANCGLLSSVSLPQAQTVGDNAFLGCQSLTSINLPQATSIGDYAFFYCITLTAVHMARNAPAEATNVFENITPPPNVYVTDPQATGWGAEWNGAPVVRPPLYGSNVTAQAFTLGGDTITEWPAGGGETSIIAPLYDSGTNVTVTSTQSVYSVAVTGAGPVGIDWSGLGLDGTGRAEVTLRINVTEWAGTNITFSPSLTFDQTPEILVTGVWEFAASTIDGVTTRVRQTWPECCAWQMADYGTASGPSAGASYGGGALPSIGNASNNTLRFRIPQELVFVRATIYPNMTPPTADQVTLNLSATVITNGLTAAYNNSRSFQQYTYQYPRYEFWCVSWIGSYRSNDGPRIIYTRLYSNQDSAGLYPQFFVETRRLDANERAAYLAGWRP